jgi:predicted TIM-barrel fold metal-dependent hydrolase
MEERDIKKIDVHHHITPAEYVNKLASIGITESLGQPFPKWSIEKSLSFMKKIGIDIAIMSISTPGVYFRDDNFSRDFARMCNEYMAGVKSKYPNNFGGFASIPLPELLIEILILNTYYLMEVEQFPTLHGELH